MVPPVRHIRPVGFFPWNWQSGLIPRRRVKAMSVSDGAARAESAGPVRKDGSYLRSPGQGLEVWPLMRWLWAESELPQLRKCHRIRRQGGVDVYVAAEGGRVWFGGYCRCHSVWACPLCAPPIRSVRAKELSYGLGVLLGVGGGCLFSTYTVPHDQGQPLVDLYSKVQHCWELVQKDRTVSAIRKRLELEWSRSTEVTVGANGWHPHLHIGEVCWRPLTRDEVVEYRAACFKAWCRAVEGVGLRRPSDRYGLSMIRADQGMGDYMHKVEGLASELFRMDRKTAKTIAPFELLAKAVTGDGWAERRWREYERATKGRKMMGTSKGFAELARHSPLFTDDEILEAEARQGVWVGHLNPEEAHLLTYSPRGFEGFIELVGPGTQEAFEHAVRQLVGQAPWFLTNAGWERASRELHEDQVVAGWLPEELRMQPELELQW